MKELIIESPKYGPHVVLLDDEDYDRVTALNWCLAVVKRCPHLRYAYNAKTKTWLHRFIMNIQRCVDVKTHVDHKDGNGLNCQKENLRLCTSAQNQGNRIAGKRSKTGHKGAYYDKTQGCFVARIGVNRRRVFLGNHDTLEAAVDAYNKASVFYKGEFSRTNEYQSASV